MEDVSKNHAYSVLACTLKVCAERDPYIKNICKIMQKSNLKIFQTEVLLKKLKSILLHCSVTTLSYLFRRGLFCNKFILSMVVNIIKHRRLEDNPAAREIVYHQGKCIN